MSPPCRKLFKLDSRNYEEVELKRACQHFNLRLEEIIKAEGGYTK
jgi:hypothetical protein